MLKKEVDARSLAHNQYSQVLLEDHGTEEINEWVVQVKFQDSDIFVAFVIMNLDTKKKYHSVFH